MIIGVVMDGRPLTEALHRYAVLSVGDGLVSQIPAILISTASGVIVTKTSIESRLSQAMALPFLSIRARWRRAQRCSPGSASSPAFPAFRSSSSRGSCMPSMSRPRMWRRSSPRRPRREGRRRQGERWERLGVQGGRRRGESQDSKGVEELLTVDRLNVEIGYRLIPLVDPGNGAGLRDHISMVRRQFATQEGYVMPPCGSATT